MTTELKQSERGLRKQRKGVVVSKSGDKSIVVRVARREPHPEYGKIVRTAQKFHVHDEGNQAQVGDEILMLETRPLSKMKRWRLIRIVQRAAEGA